MFIVSLFTLDSLNIGSKMRDPFLFSGAPKHATLLKKKLWHSCFPVNFAKLRTPLLQNTSGQLLLKETALEESFSDKHTRPVINAVSFLRNAFLILCC